jgi:transcriptional regulator with XRE-family HTH domain
MKLDDFLSSEKITGDAFAKQLGVSPSMITRLRHGERSPSIRLVERIENVTKGKVRPSDFFRSANEAP